MEKLMSFNASHSNVLSFTAARKARIPSLTELARQDADVLEMVKIIAEFELREKAVGLISKRLARPKFKRPSFF